MKKLIILSTLLVSTVLASAPALAARAYDIEVILFQRLVAPGELEENWPNELPAIDYANTLSAANQAELEQGGVVLLPASSKQMTKQYQALSEHGQFKPLAHLIWRQAELNQDNAPVIRLAVGQNFAGDYYANGLSRRWHTASQAGLSQSGQGILPELEGTLQIFFQHFAFIDANFDLRIPTEQHVSVQTAAGTSASRLESFLKSYRMSDLRRMRGGEIHYIDHPLMGIIVQVRPVP
uniref:peptidoglycan binding protein CsiV n=1 Tax=Thaumasiovibrio occultus TaxID=1891184 RepID=UPI000B34AF16|nr:peptidoglycan binding protein CsiV [Thaumasiovibrio occultus]